MNVFLDDDLFGRHVDRHVELRERLERGRDDLHGERGDGERRRALARLLRVPLPDLFEARDVGRVVLRDERNLRPRRAEMFGRLAADAAHRLTLYRAPFAEVRQRFGGDMGSGGAG